MDIINKRRSVRSFLPNPIEEEKIELLLRAAMQAPSARNQQACKYLVVKKRNILDKISDLLPNAKMVREAPLVIVVLIDQSVATTPHMMPQDASSATTNILLEATSLEIGSCWCGIYPNNERMENLSKCLDIPKDYQVFSLIALGYPKDKDALRFIDRFDRNKILSERR